MCEMTVDSITAERMMSMDDLATIKDESGTVLGQFLRSTPPPQDPLGLGVTEAELRRRAASSEPTYTTTDVLAYAKGRTR